jgi:hypothetical protein
MLEKWNIRVIYVSIRTKCIKWLTSGEIPLPVLMIHLQNCWRDLYGVSYWRVYTMICQANLISLRMSLL